MANHWYTLVGKEIDDAGVTIPIGKRFEHLVVDVGRERRSNAHAASLKSII
jgi:hypothetical protein